MTHMGPNLGTPPFCSRWPAMVGIGVLLASGMAYRTLASYYTRVAAGSQLPPRALERLPMELGGWRGRDVPLDAQIIKATGTDQILSRNYFRSDGGASVSLLISYGIRLRDLLPHRPEVCYTTHGWTLRRTGHDTLVAGDRGSLPCEINAFDRAGISAEALVVLHYYLVDGQYCEDVSLLRSMVWKKDTASHYCAQIQVAVRVNPLAPDMAEAVAKSFAGLSAPLIRSVLQSSGIAP
jgi:EpsI family protein